MKIQNEPLSKTDIIVKKVFPIFLELGFKVREMFFERNHVDLLVFKLTEDIYARKPEWIVKVTTDTIGITKKFDLFEKMMTMTECTKGLVMNANQFIFYKGYFGKDGRYSGETRELFSYSTTKDISEKIQELLR